MPNVVQKCGHAIGPLPSSRAADVAHRRQPFIRRQSAARDRAPQLLDDLPIDRSADAAWIVSSDAKHDPWRQAATWPDCLVTSRIHSGQVGDTEAKPRFKRELVRGKLPSGCAFDRSRLALPSGVHQAPILRNGSPSMSLRSICSRLTPLVSGTSAQVNSRNATLKAA